MSQLFNEDNSYSNKNKTLQNNKSSIDVFKTANNTNNNSKTLQTLNKKNISEEKKDDDEYNDFQKEDFFVTNIKSP